MFVYFCYLLIRRPPLSTRTAYRFPYSTRCRSRGVDVETRIEVRTDECTAQRVLRADLGSCGRRQQLIIRDTCGRYQVGDRRLAERERTGLVQHHPLEDRKSTRLNSSH